MKRFLAVFTGTPGARSAWDALSDEERAQRRDEGMAAWTRWAADHAAAIEQPGGPLSQTLRVSATGIAEARNQLAAFTIVRAESQADAAAMFRDHPHFTVFPGDGVEIMEILPVPTA